MALIELKTKIVELGKFLYEKGYIVATDGNISVRLNRNEMLITSSGICKGTMSLKDIVKMSIVNPHDQPEDKRIKPSTEHQMHHFIYQQRQDVNAIIHAHPVFSTVWTFTKKRLNSKLLTETAETLGTIKLIGYFKPGSLQLAQAVARLAVKYNVILLKRHGVVVLGSDLAEAKYRLERLEFLAKISFLHAHLTS
ncbi:MAG: class II aldolase/adducin family protein [candidate division WOR-3 bacterium]